MQQNTEQYIDEFSRPVLQFIKDGLAKDVNATVTSIRAGLLAVTKTLADDGQKEAVAHIVSTTMVAMIKIVEDMRADEDQFTNATESIQ